MSGTPEATEAKGRGSAATRWALRPEPGQPQAIYEMNSCHPPTHVKATHYPVGQKT